MKTTIAPDALFGLGGDAGSDETVTLIARLILDAGRSDTPSVAFIGRDSDDASMNRWDLMALPDTQVYMYRRLAADMNTQVEFGETEIVMTIAMERIDPTRPIELRINVAASMGIKSYSSEAIGTAAIKSVELFLED